jgi:integrase
MASAHIKTKTVADGSRRYVVRYRPGGRSSPTRYAGTFRTKPEAEARLKVVRHALAELREPTLAIEVDDVRNLAAAFDRFLASRIDLSPATLKVYRQARDRLGALGRRVPSHVTVEDVQAWVGVLHGSGLAASTVRKYLDPLRMTLDDCRIDPNPARSHRLRLPKQESTEVDPPSLVEWEAIRSELRGSWRLLFELIEASGLRIGEALKLKWGDVDFLTGRVRVARDRTKGRSVQGRRFVPVADDLMVALGAVRPLEDRDPDSAVFVGLTADAARKQLAKACLVARVASYSPHALRHRFISRLVLAGVPITRVRQLAGHSKESITTDIYSHVLIDEPAESLERLRSAFGGW